MERRTFAGLAVLSLAGAIVLAACGGSSATTAPSAEASASAPLAGTSAEASGPASEAPAVAPTEAAPTSSSGFVPSLQPGSAADLEAQLPLSIGSVTFTKTSFDAGKIPGSAAISAQELDPLIKGAGKTTADVSFAIAQALDPAAGTTAIVFALRINGIDSAKLVDWAKTNMGDGSEKEVSVGGKRVFQTGEAPAAGYFYVKGDTLYAVAVAMPADLGPKIVAVLP